MHWKYDLPTKFLTSVIGVDDITESIQRLKIR